MSFENLGEFTNFEEKINFAKEFFKDFFDKEIQSFSSPLKHFRIRAEFAFFHKNDKIFYAMFDKQSKRKIIITHCDFVDEKICTLMPLLLEKLNVNRILKEKLFGVEFLATKKELSVTLLYHKDIFLIKDALENLRQDLHTNLIARSRAKKLVFGKENLHQNLQVFKEDFFYIFNNDCFIQPNTFINEKMIEWVLRSIQTHEKRSLLELYCGYGNFTLVLAKYFQKVLATELSKKNIEFALQNCLLNKIQNIDFIRMSSEDLAKAFKGEREFFRLRNLNLQDFDFSHILLDPPRAGLDESVINLAKNYEYIIYISCNPLSLKENLKMLCESHNIVNFAFFDQFVGTSHLECGTILKRNKNV